MEISILPDPNPITHSFPFLKSPNKLSLSFHVSSASPPSTRTITRRKPRTIRRVKRKTGVQDNDEKIRFLDENGDGFFGNGNGNGSGSGSGSGSGNGGWNWDGFSEGEGDNNNTLYDPAFDFVYGVLCWIALSDCLVFSFKRVVSLFGDREKVSVDITTPY